MFKFSKYSMVVWCAMLFCLGYNTTAMAVNCKMDTLYNYEFDSLQNKKVTGRIIYHYFPNNLTKEYIKQSYTTGSNTWLNEMKSVYTYNASWKLSEQLTSQWEVATKQWKNNLQFLYDYDAAGNNITFTYNSWNSSTNKWQGLVKNNFAFDNANREIEFYNQLWDNTAKQWVNQNKQEHAFDQLGRDTQYSTYAWDKAGMFWVGDKRTIQIYNANGQNTNTINRRYIPFLASWEVEWQTSYTYNAYGLLVKRYVMAFTLGKWKPYQKILYEYDSAKLCTLANTYTNDTFVGVDTVYLNQKTFYQYDANRRVTEELIQYRNVGLNTFRNDFRTQTVYDAYNQKSEEIISNWSIPLGKWLKYYRNFNVYNSDTNLVKYGQELANNRQQWVPSYETHYTYNAKGLQEAVDRYLDWDTIKQLYTSHRRDEYSCQAAPATNITGAQLTVLKVYPNPSMGQTLHITSPWSAAYVLYNTKGQIVVKGHLVEGDNLMQFEQLKAGLYFIQCKDIITRFCITAEQ